MIDLAARAIREGKLVVMPTETVYGLAADATNDDAIAKIYAAKGRPADNPLIIHIAGLDQLDQVATDISDAVLELGRHFWPGPLTIVLAKAPSISRLATSGLETVAVRVPQHPMARELCRRSERPLAAPSANLFTQLSPTRVEHISPEIRAASEVVLDGGASKIGIESTILSLVGQPRLLRTGHISAGQLAEVLGQPIPEASPERIRLAPGQYARHYAPRTPLVLVDQLARSQPGLTFGDPQNPHQLHMPLDPIGYAMLLYHSLYQLDGANLESIGIERPPETADWSAVWERLRKASAPE